MASVILQVEDGAGRLERWILFLDSVMLSYYMTLRENLITALWLNPHSSKMDTLCLATPHAIVTHDPFFCEDCLKDLTGGIEYAAKILNEIPQKDIQCSKRASKAEREGNGQGRVQKLSLNLEPTAWDNVQTEMDMVHALKTLKKQLEVNAS